MEYTQVPSFTFESLQLNAGILVDEFTPSTGVIGNLLGATTGGISFNSNPSYIDFGEDIDNCPNNMMELKKLTGYDPTMSGTFLTVSPAAIKNLLGAADVDTSVGSHVIPRNYITDADFLEDVWWIGDYSDRNEETTGTTSHHAGFLAIHLKNVLNVAGFQITSSKDAKGQMSFEYHAHYSIDDQDEVPFEIYCKSGT